MCTSFSTVFSASGATYRIDNDIVQEDAIAQDTAEADESNRVIVKFKDKDKKEKFKKDKKRKIKKNVKNDDVMIENNSEYSIVELEGDDFTEDFIENMKEEYKEDIEIIQPDYIVNFFAEENNSREGSETTISLSKNTTVPAAITDGKTERVAEDIGSKNLGENIQQEVGQFAGDEIIVAVIDTGIDIQHQSLRQAIQYNTNEFADGIDTDGNGYIDDIYGWDFINNTDLSEIVLDSNHGTHVAGLIVADGIGKGVNAKILPLKVFEDGVAYTSNIINAIQYAETMGAKIVNCSWGTSSENPALEDAIESSDMLFVCAAGNSGINIDEMPIYPASYEFNNIISVGASNDRDYPAYFSNYGNSVDLAANGYKVYSATTNNHFGEMMGTSMSAAYITGVAAAVYKTSANDTKQQVLDTCDKISTLVGHVSEGRRISYDNAVSNIIVNDITKNTNTDYDIERMNEITGASGGFELYDLDPEPAKIYAGLQHSVIINNWGLVNAYGDDTYHQLGQIGESSLHQYCGTIGGLDNVDKVSTFANHNLALQNGGVYAWGQNDRYQLGNTASDSSAIPIQVEFFKADGTIPTIVDVAAGGWFSLALDSEGNVWAWGDNTYGQIAVGYAGYRLSIPKIIMSGVSDISAGKYHALAVKDGIVYGWGRNAEDYPIGENAAWSQPTPVQITGLSGTVIDIEAGDRCSFFITSSGIYALGLNNCGQLGDGTTSTQSIPILLDITASEIKSNGSTLFLSEGSVYACGANTYGQLGQGYSNTRSEIPVKISGENYKQMATGGAHNLLFKCNEQYPEDQWYYRNATVYAMGRSDHGQCIKNADSILYPEAIIEIQNTEEDELPFHGDYILRVTDAECLSQNGIDNTYAAGWDGDNFRVNYTGNENGDTNHGKYSYFKFNLSAVPKEYITRASLWVYVENDGDYRKSTREIGIFDTYSNAWSHGSMSWAKGRVSSRSLLGSFLVSADGYQITDPGWREIDLTEYIKNTIDVDLSLMLKMISTTGHEVALSGQYSDYYPSVLSKYRPALAINCDMDFVQDYERRTIPAARDTYVAQRTPEHTSNYLESPYLSVNYTSSETGNKNYGNYSYIDFNISGINKEAITSVKLWVYVDPESDNRSSQRTVGVFKPKWTWVNSMTWENDRAPSDGDAIASFTVRGNGYNIVDPGWKCVEVTDYVKNLNTGTASFMLKAIQSSAHPVKLRSSEHANKETAPQLVIEYTKRTIRELFRTKTVSCKKDTVYKMIMDVQLRDISNKKFVIKYDPAYFELRNVVPHPLDTHGEGGNISVDYLKKEEGSVSFKNIWSEEYYMFYDFSYFDNISNIIEFKALQDGESEITIGFIQE